MMSLRINGQLLITGAIGVVLAGILVFIFPGPDGLSGPSSIPTDVVSILSGIALILGLPVLYRTQAKRIGAAGRIGALLLGCFTFVNFIFTSGVEFLDVAFPGSVPHDRPHGPPTFVIIAGVIGVLALLAGGLIAGIATLRARVLPVGVGWLILLGTVASVLSFALPLDALPSQIVTSVGFTILMIPFAWAGALITAQPDPALAAQS
jgi:hypothetical protein